jgi:hypothetical protein
MKIDLTLLDDDAAPILREAAEDAAKFGAWLDYITRKTWQAPSNTGERLDDARKRWQARFLRAKRIVEAFGIEYEATSEQETMTVTYRSVGGTRTRKVIGRLAFNVINGSRLDYDHPEPCYRSEVHAEACRQAAKRVVHRWRAALVERRPGVLAC